MMLFPTLFLCFFVSLGQGSKWDYSDTTEWVTHYPNCGGTHQSPININTGNLTCNNELASQLTYTKYSSVAAGNFTITNNGHTCTVDSSAAGASISIKGEQYNLVQFHFHWGSVNTKGSEHQVNSVKYPAELHLVHYNNKYGSFSNAKNKSDGLAVLGVFIKVGKENEAFNNFLNLNVSTDNSAAKFKAFAVQEVLPSEDDRQLFYRYHGSLTTPTCDQSITWTVFSTPIEIGQDQLDKFRALKLANGQPMVNNFRPVQALNDREVLTTFDQGSSSCENSAGLLKSSLLFVLCCAFLRFLF